MRACTRCQKEKPLESFAHSPCAKNGLHTWCRVCKAETSRQWHAKNRKRKQLVDRQKYTKNGARIRANAKAWYATHTPQSRLSKRSWSLRQYGLTIADFDRLLGTQDGSCAICNKKPPGSQKLVVDHCHETHLIRGLLCRYCNIGLGYFLDSPDLLNAAINYLIAARVSREKK